MSYVHEYHVSVEYQDKNGIAHGSVTNTVVSEDQDSAIVKMALDNYGLLYGKLIKNVNVETGAGWYSY